MANRDRKANSVPPDEQRHYALLEVCANSECAVQNVVVSFVGKENGVRYAADTALPLVSETPVLGGLAMITRARNAFQKR
jgi:hypothetical protein